MTRRSHPDIPDTSPVSVTAHLVLSLCDRTGAMVQPWLDAGYRAVIVVADLRGQVALARTARTEQAKDFSSLDAKRESVNGGCGGARVGVPKVVDFDHRSRNAAAATSVGTAAPANR